MINKTEDAAKCDYEEFDVTCAANGDLIAKELLFPYAVSQWDPRVID